ncbi:RNA polymerase sigma factor [Sphingobium nicotianae]|uniref:Sigma-70 family RNA polymerase sigma factor n=1 Tax=Sphingobium nicotianae TaxID=2782607 RepID=A0A9X1DC32_9SPHN|nr:sigma-70 family RNA polymerase sigma factor [Sphingobium nicotianae]
MAAEQLQRLQAALEKDYGPLINQLTKALRSKDRATEALHDTYVKLGALPLVGDVRNPLAYLYRMTLNLAHNVRLREARSTTAPQNMINGLHDDVPGPERTALARLDVNKLVSVLDALPAQRRNIFLARWRDDLSHIEIAALLGLHKRTVQKELAKAERFLRASAAMPE